MDIFDLMATIRLDSSEYEQGLQDAENQASGFGSKLASGLGTAAKVSTAAVGAVAAGVSAAGAAFVGVANNAASYGDNIDKASQKMGLSAEAYQEWDAILQHSGTSVDAVGRGMMTLSKAAQKGSDEFQKLGISQEQLASLNQEELFAKVVEGLQGMEEGTERAALASKLLGGSARQLGPLLNTSAEETEAMRQKVHELGGVMSNEAVKAAAKYQDTVQDMTTAIDGMKRGLVSDFLPSVTTVMEGITELFGSDSDKGLNLISEGVDNLIDGISEKLPKVIEVGGRIINSIITAITNNLPKILEAGTQLIMTLVNGLVSSLPQILSAGMQAILTLANGIAQALPELIPAAVDAILTFAEGLIDNLPQIIEAALQLMIGLAEGLVKAIPKVIEKIPQIIAAIVKALIESIPKIAEAGVELLTSIVRDLPKIISDIVASIPQIITGIVGAIGSGVGAMIDAGRNLMAGLGQGIIEKAKSVIDSVKSIGGKIVDGVKGFFGINSPSKVFASIGSSLMEGMAKGVDDNIGMVEDSLDDLGDVVDDFDNDLSTLGTTVSVVAPESVGGASGRNTGTRTEMLLQEILGALQGMGVTIDGRAFVGAVGQRMNQEFGNMSYYANREVWVS